MTCFLLGNVYCTHLRQPDALGRRMIQPLEGSKKPGGPVPMCGKRRTSWSRWSLINIAVIPSWAEGLVFEVWFQIPPRKINGWNPENTGPLEKENHLNQTIILRFYVNLPGCTFSGGVWFSTMVWGLIHLIKHQPITHGSIGSCSPAGSCTGSGNTTRGGWVWIFWGPRWWGICSTNKKQVMIFTVMMINIVYAHVFMYMLF